MALDRSNQHHGRVAEQRFRQGALNIPTREPDVLQQAFVEFRQGFDLAAVPEIPYEVAAGAGDPLDEDPPGKGCGRTDGMNHGFSPRAATSVHLKRQRTFQGFTSPFQGTFQEIC
jgi:hypothetical protein